MGDQKDVASSAPADEEDPAESKVLSDSGVDDPEDAAIDSNPVRADDALRYFGADFDIDGLVKRLNNGTFIIPTFEPVAQDDTAGYEGFQRGLVWTKKQMDRFIESILLGYPVPGIFLVELSDRRYLVLDGQQRLTTLQSFVRGTYQAGRGTRKFSLTYVGDEYRSSDYESLEAPIKRLFDNTFIQATIIVPKGSEGRRGVYSLFERINSGGTNLKPQQIRVALYAGTTVNFVRELNQDENWREMFGPHKRDLKDHELILRAIALLPLGRGIQNFKPPMAGFLNDYLELYQDQLPPDSERIEWAFRRAVALLNEALGQEALRLRGNQVNAAHTDAVLVGLMTALDNGNEVSSTAVARSHARLSSNQAYQDAVAESTSHADQVRDRIRLAVRAFQGEDLAVQ